ncbi:MAG: hypothetical protein BMS9Abin10_0228 [Gammaproteobacteria bacterium]|nr:MAG: hypothetical protein BMS9Abin10_0228 [Gammaproteobacteria bacterium]
MPRIGLVAVFVFLAGCQTYYDRFVDGNERSPYFEVAVDSKLVLKDRLTIPANTDRVYFQNGRIYTAQDTNEYLAYCMLQTRTRKDTPQTIEPDEFVVRKVYQQTIYQLASGESLRLAQIDGGGGGVMEYRVDVAIMEISSEKQADITRLVCGRWELPLDQPHITIADMRTALGRIFELRLANPRAG